MAMIAHLIQDTASSLETRFLPPTVGIYRAYVRTGPIEECLALFQQAEEETQDVLKAEKAVATQQLYAELIMEALETSEMENSRVAALRRYIKNYVETLFKRAKDPGCLLKELGNRYSLLVSCVSHVEGSLKFLNKRSVLYSVNRIHTSDLTNLPDFYHLSWKWIGAVSLLSSLKL